MTEPARKTRKRGPRGHHQRRLRTNQKDQRRAAVLERYWATAVCESVRTGNPVVKGFFGTLNPYPFSNHALVPTKYKGAWYRSSEHAYLAEQAREYGRHDLAEAWKLGKGGVRENGRTFDWANPKSVKAYSTKAFRPYRNPSHPARKRWLARRLTVMFQIVMSKYRRNATAKAALLRSGHQFLVEASPHDDFWGIGTSLDSNRHAYDDLEAVPQSWGQNRLGLVTMGVRNQLRRRKHRTVEITKCATRFLIARARKRGPIVRPSVVRQADRLVAKGAYKPVPTPPLGVEFDPLVHFRRQLVPGIATACAEIKRKMEHYPVPCMPFHLRKSGGARNRPYDPWTTAHVCSVSARK